MARAKLIPEKEALQLVQDRLGGDLPFAYSWLEAHMSPDFSAGSPARYRLHDLQRRLAASELDHQPASAGRKISAIKLEIVGEAAGWLAANGRPVKQEKLEAHIEELLEERGLTTSISTVRYYAAPLIRGFDKALIASVRPGMIVNLCRFPRR